MPHAKLAKRPWPVPGEIGADYSPRVPNCNAADRRKRAENRAGTARGRNSGPKAFAGTADRTACRGVAVPLSLRCPARTRHVARQT
jgi:hypothetical protein